MNTIERRILLTVLAVSSSLAATGCGADAQSGTAGNSRDIKAYDDAAVALKQANPSDYEAELAQLQTAYDVHPSGEAGDAAPSSKTLLPPASGDVVSSTAQALSWGTPVYSATYNVHRTHHEVMRLTAGQRLDWYTTTVTPGADPVMVLFQYESTNSDCTVPFTAMPKLSIKAFNDDFSGAQSRFQYTVPSSGCYALVIYAYSPSSTGTVRLHKDGCNPPPPPQCSGQNPTVCTQSQPTCWVSTVDTGPTVPADGVAVRGFAMDFMATSNITGGADPWLFAFNFSTANGAANDDTASNNSAIDRTDFSLSATHPNAAVLAGYNTWGTATFTGYRR